jgi:hypothetical protein
MIVSESDEEGKAGGSPAANPSFGGSEVIRLRQGYGATRKV